MGIEQGIGKRQGSDGPSEFKNKTLAEPRFSSSLIKGDQNRAFQTASLAMGSLPFLLKSIHFVYFEWGLEFEQARLGG